MMRFWANRVVQIYIWQVKERQNKANYYSLFVCLGQMSRHYEYKILLRIAKDT